MEGQIDSHQWASKMETHWLISGKPDLEIEADVHTAGEEPFETHLLQGGQAASIYLFLQSQAARVKRLLSKKAHLWQGRHSAESIAAHRFTSQLSSDLSRFKA